MQSADEHSENQPTSVLSAMKLPRRQFLHLAAGAAALPVIPRIARAQAYPSRPVRVVVSIVAGGVARSLYA